MKKFLVNNHSDNIVVFFTGWGCDNYEFEHLKSSSDILILYEYCDFNLNLDFDFSKYKKIDLLAFSAGVFVASVSDTCFISGKKIALNGNPYLFDERLGLSLEIQDLLSNITEENAIDFAKNYLIKTEEEFANFHPSKRTLDSCRKEFDCLKKLYNLKSKNIKDIYDIAIIGEDDRIFDTKVQKEFYGPRLRTVENARHNLFFKFKSYTDIFSF